jgi:transcriptional regulator with XRE-family HTH domain
VAISGPRVFIERNGWRRARTAYKLQRHNRLAAALGVSETTIWRVLTREDQRPGEEFIARSLELFSDPDIAELKFDDLFVVKREQIVKRAS